MKGQRSIASFFGGAAARPKPEVRRARPEAPRASPPRAAETHAAARRNARPPAGGGGMRPFPPPRATVQP